MNGQMEKFTRSKLELDNKRFLAQCTTNLGMTRKKARKLLDGMHRDEIWVNDQYQVNIDKINEGHGMWHLSIKRLDKEPIHDWRDLQRIKTELCGEEAEAVEIYPAESRLIDGANQYHLWAFIDGKPIPFGFNEGRQVSDTNRFGGGKQRATAPEETGFEDEDDSWIDTEDAE